MRILAVAAMSAVLAGLTAPAAHAQVQTPNINLLADTPSKTPEEKEADEQRDKAYRESLKKIPDAKTSSDPWGGVRSDTPKAPAGPKTSVAKSTTAPKPKAKTGSTTN